MISNQLSLNLSPFMAIYDIVVPKDNMLRQINDLVDFSFVHEELQNKYCLDNGRNAVPPIRMFKYLLLKSIFDLSDVNVVERSKYDMSLKYFLDMAPEDEVINPSSLTKFRKLRLKDVNLLDMMIQKTVEIALEKEIIKSRAIIVDTTHTKARFNQQSPKEILMEKSRLLRKAVYQIDEKMKEKFPPKTTTNELADELKKIASSMPAKMNYNSYQNYTRRLPRALVKKKRDLSLTKSAGMYVCKAGHMAIRRTRTGRKNVGKNQVDTYYFDTDKCKQCPFKEGCYKEGARSKTYSISIKSTEHREQQAFQEGEYFKEKAKERYKIEAKNSELKHRHGYDVASTSGLVGMDMQGAMAIFAVNLKRILTLLK